MQHHLLNKYLEFTVNKKPDKMKKQKNFADEHRKFFKILLLKKDAHWVNIIGDMLSNISL